MNLPVLIVTLLVFGALDAESRAIRSGSSSDSDEVDNSIDMDQQFDPFETHNWVKFTKIPPSKIEQTIGTPIEIECEVMGSQVPTIRWVVGSRPAVDMDDNDLTEGSPSSIVRVRSMHIIDHIISEPKTYTCVGRSGGKYVYASTIVYPAENLEELPKLNYRTAVTMMAQRKPRITYSERLHLDLVGSDIVLPCRVAARSHADISWISSHGQIIQQNHRYQILSSGDLSIADLKWEDMGVYKCIAENGFGKDTTDTFVYPVLNEEETK